MKAYKLVRKMKDGSIASLFIDKKARLTIGEWLQAEEHPTKGYAFRPFWHCTSKMIAPHLSKKGRVWVECEIEDYKVMNRPECQGGTWYLANRMKIVREIS